MAVGDEARGGRGPGKLGEFVGEPGVNARGEVR
jgi:hypothetical protein